MPTNTPDRYFLLIYDIPKRDVEIEEFGADFDSAADKYAMLEARHRDNRNIEVLLVGADSIETIKKTHSHYFAERAEDLFRFFLEQADEEPVVSGPR